MKLTPKVGAFLTFTVLSLLPGFAHGQTVKGQVLVGPVGGIVIPIGETKGDAKPGYSAGISIDQMVADRVAVGLDFELTRFGKASGIAASIFGPPADPVRWAHIWRLFHFGAHGKFFLISARPFRPFLRIGAGAYVTRMSYSASDTWQSKEALAVGFDLGAGVNSRVGGRVRGTLEAAFHSIDLLGDSATLKYWSLGCGLAYQFGPR